MSLEAPRGGAEHVEVVEMTPADSGDRRVHRDWPGTLIGLLVFLGGIGLLLLTFARAYSMFSVPPAQALGVRQGQPLDIGYAGQTFAGMVLQVLLLLVMAAIGSVIANRGIKLYSDALRVVGKRR